jgi:tetratricopeptide (TPR) repeat protein
VVLAWAFTTFGSFWINTNRYDAWRNTAILQEQTGDLKDAVANINHALQLNPADANSHLVLAAAYTDQNDVADAIPEYVRTLQLDPDKIPALITLASLLANGQPDDVERAIHIATHACELTAYRDSSSVNTLADILVKGKKWDDARSTAQIACELARQEGDGPLLRKNQALLESIRTNSIVPGK